MRQFENADFASVLQQTFGHRAGVFLPFEVRLPVVIHGWVVVGDNDHAPPA